MNEFKDISQAPARKPLGRPRAKYISSLDALPVNKCVEIELVSRSDYQSKRSVVKRWIVKQSILFPFRQYDMYILLANNLIVSRFA